MSLDWILYSTENDYIDFKQKWYSKDKLGTVNLVHDILCMSNSLTNSSERYIIIGVEESKTKSKIIHDVLQDSNSRQSADIIQTLRNYMSIIPNIEILREKTDDGYIDIIKIIPAVRDLPYVLNKICEYQEENGKKHTVRKDWIYSRNSDRNTPIDECCTKAELEELFARKKGEHLPVLDRFSLFLDDIQNWKRPRRYDNEEISEDAFYYVKNHKYKIVLQPFDYDKLIKLEDATNYAQLLSDTALGLEYWNYRNKPNHSCYDDYYHWFNIELWADNTLIEVFSIMKIFIKYFFRDNNYSEKQTFYLPTMEDVRRIYNIKTKCDIEASFVWKLCKLLFLSELGDNSPLLLEDASIILDALNYDYLQNTWDYINQNKDWIYNSIKKQQNI